MNGLWLFCTREQNVSQIGTKRRNSSPRRSIWELTLKHIICHTKCTYALQWETNLLNLSGQVYMGTKNTKYICLNKYIWKMWNTQLIRPSKSTCCTFDYQWLIFAARRVTIFHYHFLEISSRHSFSLKYGLALYLCFILIYFYTNPPGNIASV